MCRPRGAGVALLALLVVRAAASNYDDVKEYLTRFNFSGELADIQFVDAPSANASGEKSVISQPYSELADTVLPDTWMWGNINSRSYLTPMKNQNEPQYCGCCWAHSTISALSDRIKIGRAASGKSTGSDVALSVQALLNCGKKYAGTCSTGNMAGVYHWIMNVDGLPYESCQNYRALDTAICDEANMCRICVSSYDYESNDDDDMIARHLGEAAPRALSADAAQNPIAGGSANATGAAEDDDSSNHPITRIDDLADTVSCFGVADGRGYSKVGGIYTNGVPKATVSSYGFVAGERRMREEILARGPIACLVDSTSLNSYASGIIDVPFHSVYDHSVSIVGWGESDGTKCVVGAGVEPRAAALVLSRRRAPPPPLCFRLASLDDRGLYR